jgi:hypothetical protein
MLKLSVVPMHGKDKDNVTTGNLAVVLPAKIIFLKLYLYYIYNITI